MKTVIFSDSSTAAARLLSGVSSNAVRIVVPSSEAASLREHYPEWCRKIVPLGRGPAGLTVWLRLLVFLGFSPAAVLCTSSRHAPWMKLLALLLRGRIQLVDERGATPLSLGGFLWLAWLGAGRGAGPICLVGTASPDHLRAVVADVRRRYPGSPVHAFVPRGAESLDADHIEPLRLRKLLRAGRTPFVTVVLPLAGDGYGWHKLLAWCLPLGRREIYNENCDSYLAREVHVLARHVAWRLKDALFVRLKAALFRQPPGLTIVAAAPPDVVRAIVEDVRRRHSGACAHGILPRRLASLANLFDSVTIVRPLFPTTWGSLLGRMVGRDRSGYLVVPSTGDGYALLKLFCWFLPLGRREIYNENLNCCAARDWRPFLRHVVWLLRRVPRRVTILASARPARLTQIVADVRRRHPGAPCYGLLPPAAAECASLFDEAIILRPFSLHLYGALLGLMVGSGRSGYLVVPATREGHTLLKVLAWLLPLGRREVYNENNDFYSARDPHLLFRHVQWRLTSPNFWKRVLYRLTQRPERVTVVGSASGLYLEKIVTGLRARYPAASIHGLLPESLAAPAGRIFDSYTVVRPLSPAFWRSIARLALGRRRSGHLIVPCTNEGYAAMKVAGVFLPLGLREIWNENGDACELRQVPVVARHALWRLRHRIFYQGLAERRGRPVLLHLVHLACYPFRLAAGAALLLYVRLRLLAATLVRTSVRPSETREPAVRPPEPQFERTHTAVGSD